MGHSLDWRFIKRTSFFMVSVSLVSSSPPLHNIVFVSLINGRSSCVNRLVGSHYLCQHQLGWMDGEACNAEVDETSFLSSSTSTDLSLWSRLFMAFHFDGRTRWAIV